MEQCATRVDNNQSLESVGNALNAPTTIYVPYATMVTNIISDTGIILRFNSRIFIFRYMLVF